MGYRIGTIKNLPENLGCYFFLIGDYRNSSMVNDLFRDGFDIIADRIGLNNAVVEKTDTSHVEWELAKALHRKVEAKSVLSDCILEFESRIPGLLVSWNHPDKLTDKDAVVHIPFQVLDESYDNTTVLLCDLIDFANKKNLNLIDKIRAKHKVIKGLSFSVNLGIFALNFDL